MTGVGAVRAVRILVALSVVAATPVAAQPASAGIRLVEARTEPATVEFGQPAVVHIELRTAPGLAVFLPDTLNTGTEMSSLGTGRWSALPAGGDSTRIAASYPIIGFRKGIRELPKLEMAVAAVPGGGAAPTVRSIREAVAIDGTLTTVEIPLGSTTVAEYASIENAPPDEVLAPRPPADVVGGRWNPWMLLVVGLATLAGAGGIGALLPRWWEDRGARLIARLRGRSPKQETLRELDGIRSLGWHRDGRVDDFYASSTDALRVYASRLHPGWTPALTTRELFARIEARSGLARAARLGGALARAERVKFGTDRPGPEAAEEDWATIRDWVRDAPDA